MWASLSTVALVVQACLLVVKQLPLTSVNEEPHLSGLARTSCVSQLERYLSPNMSEILVPMCALAEPKRLLQKAEPVQNVELETNSTVLNEMAADDDQIQVEDPSQWWAMYGAMIAVAGLSVAPFLLVLKKMPRTLVDFLLRSTVFLFMASLVASYLGNSLHSNTDEWKFRSTFALVVMGSTALVHMVASFLLSLCTLAWPTGLTMAIYGVYLERRMVAPALVMTAVVAWLTLLGFHRRQQLLQKPRTSFERNLEASRITKRSRAATPPINRPEVLLSAGAGGA